MVWVMFVISYKTVVSCIRTKCIWIMPPCPNIFLTRAKSAFGFQTGDLVRAVVTTGKKAGTYLGRVAIRASGSFNIQTGTGLIQGIPHRFCTLIQRADGYGYSFAARQGERSGGA